MVQVVRIGWAAAAACAALLIGCEKPAAPAAAPAAGAGGSTGAGATLRIAVVPKGTTHEFWKSVHAGAIKAGRELSTDASKVEVSFRGPEREDDREQQVSLVQNLISAKVSAIVLAPLDETALVGPVRQATAAKIPVVVIDSGLKASAGTDFVSFVATDNFKGGQLAAERMAASLKGQGRVLVLRYQEGSASTALREDGFIDGMKSQAGITVIDPRRYAGATRATAQEAAENLLAANGDIQGVYCPNESSTFGMLLALRSRGLAGKVVFVGFDASEALVAALRSGEIDALVLQNPMRIGELGVRAAVDHLRGAKVEPRLDTGVQLVTRGTMDQPDVEAVLSPDLSKYLGKP